MKRSLCAGGEIQFIFYADYILSDSKSALEVIESVDIKFKLLGECVKLLKGQLSSLIWVPGHSGIKYNEMADQKAGRTSSY